MPSHNLGKLTQSATDAMNDKDAKDVPLRFASSNDWASRQPQTNAKPKFLKKKFQIGSIKGQQNFRHEEHAFHPDEIAPAKMKNKEDLRKWKKYKNQGPGVPISFDNSVEWIVDRTNDRTKLMGEFDRPMWPHNFRAEVLPEKAPEHIHKPNKFRIETMTAERRAEILAEKKSDPLKAGVLKRFEEFPNHPNIVGKKPWRTHELNLTETWAIIHQFEDARRANSVKYNSRLNKVTAAEAQRETMSAAGDGRGEPDASAMVLSKVSPDMAAATLALLPAEQRVKVMAGLEQNELSKLMTHMGPEAPVISEINKEAKTRIPRTQLKSGKGTYIGPVDAYKQKLSEIRRLKAKGVNIAYASKASEEAATPTYNRYAKESMDKLRTFKHSGIYGFNEDEGRWMWSDTGSFEKESRGDMVRVTNPNGLNLAAPTSCK